MKKDKKEKLEDIFLFIALIVIIVGLVLFATGCSSKKETIQCLGGNLYNVIPNTSYILIRKGCTGE